MLTRMACFSKHAPTLISARPKPASHVVFAVHFCYLKNVGFTPDKKISPSDALLTHICNGSHRVITGSQSARRTYNPF